MKTYKVVVSNKARKMLDVHTNFLAQVSPKASKRLNNKFYESVKKLELNPYNAYLDYEWVEEKRYRKLGISKYHIVVYEIKGSIVHINIILDLRQNFRI